MKSGDKGKVGKYVDTVLRTDFKHLQGDLERKCTDDALVKAVQTMMRWEKPPAKGWLFEVVRAQVQQHLAVHAVLLECRPALAQGSTLRGEEIAHLLHRPGRHFLP